MGKEIEKISLERGHQIISICDPYAGEAFDLEKLKLADIAIEYSVPSVVHENILKCFGVAVPVVVGTTGWYQQLPDIIEACEKFKATIFYSPNYSIGVNIFFRINEMLAKLMKDQPDYEVKLNEVHHTKKKDAPSGTTIKLADIILSTLERKKSWVCNEKGNEIELNADTIPITYSREDDVVGFHEVDYLSSSDKITLVHEAYSRKGFAVGTLVASEWLIGRKGVFTMHDLLQY